MKTVPNITEMAFISSFQDMQADAAAINKKNGFVDAEEKIDDLENYLMTKVPADVYEKYKELFPMFRHSRAGLKLALVESEVSETLEAVRKNLGPDDHIPEFTAEEAEWADAVLRLMNYATDRKLRGAEAIVAKNEFNRNRADHSKEGRAAVHGKKF